MLGVSNFSNRTHKVKYGFLMKKLLLMASKYAWYELVYLLWNGESFLIYIFEVKKNQENSSAFFLKADEKPLYFFLHYC